MKNNNKAFTPSNTAKSNLTGFTLIELLVVISIIGFLVSMAVFTFNTARVKARNAKRMADVKQLTKAFNLYWVDYGSLPALGGTTRCIGVLDGQTCWGDRNILGSTILINALTPYVKNLPTDPLPDRGWGDRYMYRDGGNTSLGCSTNYVGGAFILWRPDNTPGDCLGLGFQSCCGSGGPCGNEGGYFCAYKIE